MADLSAASVTYAMRNAAFTRSDQGYRRIFNLAFGDGASTYPTGGIPLTNAKLGCLNALHALIVCDNGLEQTEDKQWVWDATNNTLRAFAGATEAVGGSEVISATTLRVEAVGY